MKHKITKKQNNADMCMVCGVDNPFSLKTRFYETEDKKLVGIVDAKDIHQSYPGRMHGGIITSLLDEAIGRAIQITDENLWAVTVELTTKFIKPVPLSEELYIVGFLTTEPRKLFTGEGYICTKSGEILARAMGKYLLRTVKQITGADALDHNQWKYIEDLSKITEIELPE